MSLAQAGHGATIAIESNPVVAGTFVVVAELNGDITWPELNRPVTEVTPHQDTIDSHVHGVLTRGPLTWSVNFIYDNATHDASTGLYKHMIENTRFGVRLWGPGGSAGDDEWIMSGQISTITQTSPVREDVRTAEVTFQPSKAMKIDGVAVGTAA
jgi:hypothetical protein